MTSHSDGRSAHGTADAASLMGRIRRASGRGWGRRERGGVAPRSDRRDVVAAYLRVRRTVPSGAGGRDVVEAPPGRRPRVRLRAEASAGVTQVRGRQCDRDERSAARRPRAAGTRSPHQPNPRRQAATAVLPPLTRPDVVHAAPSRQRPIGATLWSHIDEFVAPFAPKRDAVTLSTPRGPGPAGPRRYPSSTRSPAASHPSRSVSSPNARTGLSAPTPSTPCAAAWRAAQDRKPAVKS